MSISCEHARCYIRSFVWVITRLWVFAFQSVFHLVNLMFERKTVPKVHDDILLQSASSLARAIRSRKLKSVEVVDAFIRRIRVVNPVINAVVEDRYETALKEAENVDHQLESGSAPTEADAPFLGVPFTLKDAIFVNGMKCTAGIPARASTRVFEDADLVKELKKSGAICLAVTNVSEVCMWWESNNSIYGRTRNPYDSRRIVGGSSGGEGALLGAAGSVFGVGSDIGGSIRMPAFFNGVFGHKPSPHIVSGNGTHFPVNGYQVEMFAPGPMCRYAEDLLPMLRVLAGPNVGKLQLDAQVDLSSLKVFYLEEFHTPAAAPLKSSMRDCLKQAVAHLENGFDLLPIRIDLPLIEYTLELWMNDMHVEGNPTFTEEMLDQRGDLNPYLEMLKLMVGQSRHTLPALLLGIVERLADSSNTPERREQMSAMRRKLQRQIRFLLGENGILLLPSHTSVAPYHNQPVSQPFNFVYTSLINSLALPVTQIPMGLDSDGIPLGVQVVAASNQDHLCLAVAEELEKAFGGWRNFGI